MLDLLKKYSNIIIVLVYSYFLFFHVKDKEYMKMLGATLITAFLICMNKSNNVEGLTNTDNLTDTEVENGRRDMGDLNLEADKLILGPEYIQQTGPVKFVPFESTSRMGPYDGLCIDTEQENVDELISNEDLSTYLGVQGPLESRKSEDFQIF